MPSAGAVVVSPRGVPYQLLKPIGGGAFGSVFDCLGPFDQVFALKVFQPANRPYEEVRAAWVLEATRLHRLRHPNVVYVHDFFEVNLLFYLVLERCHHSLADMLGAPFSDRLVLELSRQLLFAIQYLHDHDVVHNDLHPGNVLMVQGNEVPTCKLSDFGIALELYGHRAARPPLVHRRIMAPEVAAGGFSTKQSDLYQLGLLMYAMHTGDYPVDPALGDEAVVEAIRCGVPRARAEALGTPIGDVISVLLRRNEQYRYNSAAHVWEDLRRLDVWRN
jgi:serine/threonine-protein kinase